MGKLERGHLCFANILRSERLLPTAFAKSTATTRRTDGNINKMEPTKVNVSTTLKISNNAVAVK